MKKIMKLSFLNVLACFFFLPSCLAAQIYRVPSHSSSTYSVSQADEDFDFAFTPRFEVSIADSMLLHTITDGEGSTITSNLVALEGQVLFYMLDNFGLGLNFISARSIKEVDSMFVLDQRQISLVGKWVLTPDTNPSFYLSFGAGMLISSVEIELRGVLKSNSPIVSLGLGTAYAFTERLSLGMEWRFVYIANPVLPFYCMEASPVREDILLRLAYRF